MLLNSLNIRHHQREGLIHAQFAGTQFLYSLCIRRITREVKSAQAFDGDDLSLGEEMFGFGEGIVVL